MKTSDRVLAVFAEIAAWFARVLLAFVLVFDIVLVIRCAWLLLTEGPSQVHAWIIQISTMGYPTAAGEKVGDQSRNAYISLIFWLLIAPPLLFWVQDRLASMAARRAKRTRT